MSKIDGFGAPVSHGDTDQIQRFTDSARLMLRFAPDPIAAAKALLAEAPDFIMARCFLAGIYLIASDKRKQAKLAEQYAALNPLSDRANDRERGHIKAIRLWLEGNFLAASQAYADILFDYPRDLVALQFGHQTDFLLGQVSSNRDRPARVLNHWSERDEDLSFVLGMQAFGLEEAGQYSKAQKFALRCVSLNPRDVWGVHALAHCYEMQGKVDEGISFMEGCEQHWGSDNYMSIHNRWHLGLFRIERREFDTVLRMHDEFMTVGPSSELMDAHDSATTLWRLWIYGVDVGNRWEPLADYYTTVLDQAYMPFTEMHAMLVFTAAGRESEADALIAALKANSHGQTTSSDVIRLAGLPIAEGIRAFARGDDEEAKSKLLNVRHIAHMIGGSIAQRDVINVTLLEIALRNGDRAMVDGLLAERALQKPHSPLVDMLERRKVA